MRRALRSLLCMAALGAPLGGCGVLLGGPVTQESDRLVSRIPGRVEPAGSRYVAAATGRFDPVAIRVAAHVTVTRIDACRRYTESVFERTVVRRRENSSPGIAVDAAVLAAALGAGLLMPAPEGKIGLAVAGAVPLAADGVAYLSPTFEAPVTVTTRAPEVVAGADASGAYPCAATGDNARPLRLGALVAAGGPAGYDFELTEDEFMADGVTAGVGFTLLRDGQAIAAFAPLGAAFAAFVAARAEVRRFPTPLRLAKFTIDYPRSAAAAKARRIFDEMLPSFRAADELQAVAGLAGLAPELRRGAQRRFAELRLEGLERSMPEAARAALRAERDANTFLLNGLAAEGRARLQDRDQALAGLCRDWAEYRLRADGERRDAFQAALAREWGSDARAAAALLEACSRR